jgi:hypothetical protein
MNYKLIKKLPFENSPKIGYISKPHSTQKDNTHYWNHSWFNPENYPEFWEKVIEKDYEILTYLHKITDQIVPSTNFAIDIFENEYSIYKIHSIKRLSDNQVFTIGDNIKNNETIKSIQLIDNQIRIYSQNSFYYLKDIIKVKIPLFQTFDKIDIFEYDLYYQIDRFLNDLNIKCFNATTETNTTLPLWEINKSVCLYFSTKEKAEEYILLNKPVLSLKDLLIFFPDTYIPFKKGESATEDINTLQLEDLVKQKLK